jgi:hypothetical protein
MLKLKERWRAAVCLICSYLLMTPVIYIGDELYYIELYYIELYSDSNDIKMARFVKM